jgi:tetratricopeptide (TPR) repeat protein
VAGLDDIYNEVIDKIATPKARLLLVEMLKKEGKPQAVINACQKVLEIFPDDIHIRRLLAETYVEEGSLDLARNELENITKQINNLSYVYKLQSELFRRENKIDDAIHSLQLYLAHNESDQKAADLIEELSTSKKEEPSTMPTSTLAELYYKQGELHEAIKVYEKVVDSSPDNEKAKHRLEELRKEKETQAREMEKTQSARERKVKLLGVLERWLVAVEQMKEAAL